jgi:hypothetical protein
MKVVLSAIKRQQSNYLKKTGKLWIKKFPDLPNKNRVSDLKEVSKSENMSFKTNLKSDIMLNFNTQKINFWFNSVLKNEIPIKAVVLTLLGGFGLILSLLIAITKYESAYFFILGKSDTILFIINLFARALCTCVFLGLYYCRMLSLRLFFASKLYSLNLFYLYHNFNSRTVIHVILCLLFLILNFSEGGLFFVNNVALCESTVESLAEPGDVDRAVGPFVVNPANPVGMVFNAPGGSVGMSALTENEDTPLGLVVNRPSNVSSDVSSNGSFMTRETDFPADPIPRRFADFIFPGQSEGPGEAGYLVALPPLDATPEDTKSESSSVVAVQLLGSTPEDAKSESSSVGEVPAAGLAVAPVTHTVDRSVEQFDSQEQLSSENNGVCSSCFWYFFS